MIKVLLLFSVFVVSLAVPRLPYFGPNVQTLKNEFNIADNGNYNFAYETSDHQKREEIGEVIPINRETSELVVRGSYSYIGPDGVTYSVSYIADKNGFRPYGTHIPGSPKPSIPPPPQFPPSQFPTQFPIPQSPPLDAQAIPPKALLSLVG